MDSTKISPASTLYADILSGMIVFLVALPMCLGVAMGSGAPLISGILAGIVGGVLVGILSGSQTSVSSPSAAVTGTVAALIVQLGSFEAFLLAATVAGLIQIVLGLLRVGFIASFFPSNVIQGLLAAVGVILVLKQVPHVLGRDSDPQGNMSFHQPNHENTFSEFGELLTGIQPGSATVGLLSLVLLLIWDRTPLRKKTRVPAPLAAVVLGVVAGQILKHVGGIWAITDSHMVQVPIATSVTDLFQFVRLADFSQWANPAIYRAAVAIALVTTLETLMNLEAVDKIDPQHRVSPANRELLAQGVGNCLLGLLGGIPVSSVIVRSSLNLNAGARTKLSTIFHGMLMLVAVLAFPSYLNLIPLSCLAAILLRTGLRLINPKLIHRYWEEGRYQFAPFAVTLVAIVLTDLTTGIVIGMAVSIGFILNSNFRRPSNPVIERHLGGDVLRIQLANQVTFLNRSSLEKTLRDLPPGSHVLLDAESTDYIDPDVLSLIRDFKDQIAPDRDVHVSLQGFREKYNLRDKIRFLDHSTRQLQQSLTSSDVLRILKEGNIRFLTGQQLSRDYTRQLRATSQAQNPLAVVFSCIDSRTPAELVFDLGIGDIFVVRTAGHVISDKVLGSLEFACNVAGSKLILVMGHTRCGAVTAAVNLSCSTQTPEQATGCQHLEPIVRDIQQSIEPSMRSMLDQATPEQKSSIVETVAIRNVEQCVKRILRESQTIQRLVDEEKIAVVGAVFDIQTGKINFLELNAAFSQVDNSTAHVV